MPPLPSTFDYRPPPGLDIVYEDDRLIVCNKPSGVLTVPGKDPSLGKGNQFFLSQPQLLWDFGKPGGFTPGKLYADFEYQLAFNRYLITGKTENVLQGMLRWNI